MQEILEVFLLIVLVFLYIKYRDYLRGNPIFIFVSILLCTSHVIYLLFSNPNLLLDIGIRFDNFCTASELLIIFLFPAVIVLLGISIRNGKIYFSYSLFFSLCMYVLWGIAQQYFFQSIFHTRLIGLKLAPWSVIIIGLLFALTHYPSKNLALVYLLGGTVSSWIFLLHPNIFSLGIAHGIFGAVYYDLYKNRKISIIFMQKFLDVIRR